MTMGKWKLRLSSTAFFMLSTLLVLACKNGQARKSEQQIVAISPSDTSRLDTATFAAGCFWCVEAQLKELRGVDTVISGYTGGHVKKPTYKQVSEGTTGHAEAVRIIYKPSQISYDELLEAFFLSHDPTQLNRQGNDVGTQYRSAIFYHDATQKDKALMYIKRLNDGQVYSGKVVTEVKALGPFYVAEDYHQDYYALNPGQAYCQYVIKPKMDKFRKIFQAKLR